MKLQLTIQDVLDADSKKPIQGLFGTLTVNKGKKKEDEERIQFATTVKSVPGLDNILQNMVIEALALNKTQEEEKQKKSKAIDDSVEKIISPEHSIIMPNRSMRRSIKKK